MTVQVPPTTSTAAGQDKAAAERVAERADERQQKIETLNSKGGIALADDPRRIAARVDRLSRFYADVRPIDPSRIIEGDKGAMAAAGAVLERVINTADFVGVRYLEAGVVAAQAVGRVDVRDGAGRVVAYGTGSMVSPELLLTNHHVLPDADTARASSIEFDFEDEIDGQPLQPVMLPLDPDRFYLTDEQLDFALVRCEGDRSAAAAVRLQPPDRGGGKGDRRRLRRRRPAPRRRPKQIALRDRPDLDVSTCCCNT